MSPSQRCTDGRRTAEPAAAAAAVRSLVVHGGERTGPWPASRSERPPPMPWLSLARRPVAPSGPRSRRAAEHQPPAPQPAPPARQVGPLGRAGRLSQAPPRPARSRGPAGSARSGRRPSRRLAAAGCRSPPSRRRGQPHALAHLPPLRPGELRERAAQQRQRLLERRAGQPAQPVVEQLPQRAVAQQAASPDPRRNPSSQRRPRAAASRADSAAGERGGSTSLAGRAARRRAAVARTGRRLRPGAPARSATERCAARQAASCASVPISVTRFVRRLDRGEHVTRPPCRPAKRMRPAGPAQTRISRESTTARTTPASVCRTLPYLHHPGERRHGGHELRNVAGPRRPLLERGGHGRQRRGQIGQHDRLDQGGDGRQRAADAACSATTAAAAACDGRPVPGSLDQRRPGTPAASAVARLP